MAYSNNEIKIHGLGLPYYAQLPSVYISLTVSDVSRSGDTISCTVNASLNSLQSPNYYGYSIKVYAQLDNGSAVQLIEKPNTPNQWGGGQFGLGTKTVSSTNKTSSCTLKILMSSNCGCHASAGTPGPMQVVKSISMTAPSAVKYTLSLNTGIVPPFTTRGIASFTGAGEYESGTVAFTTATALPGYTLSHYKGTATDGTTQTWTIDGGKTSDTDGWSMVRNRSVTVYATPNAYTIFYKRNASPDDTVGSASTKKYYNEKVTPMSTTGSWLSRPGYTCIGWNTKPDGSGEWHNTEWVYTTLGNLTLYAQWEGNPYTVTYDANGGSGAPAPQTKTNGVSLTLTSAKPTTSKQVKLTFNPNGGSVNPTSATRTCSFLRWNTRPDGTGTNYNSGSTYTEDAAVTLYAIWSSVSAGELPVPTRANCIFTDWYTAVDGGSKVTSTSTFSQDTTIYARWNYIVKYNLNGGYIGDSADDDSNIPDAIKRHNEDLKLTDIQPQKSGLIFKGWARTSTATVPEYLAGSTYTNNAPTTLYAVYGVRSYTVNFDLRGGIYTGGGALVQTVEHGKNAVLPNNPTREGKVFKGWIGNYQSIQQDTTICALWNGSPVWIKKNDGNWHSYLE